MAKGGTVVGEAYGRHNGLAGVKRLEPPKSYFTVELSDARAFGAPGSGSLQNTIRRRRPLAYGRIGLSEPELWRLSTSIVAVPDRSEPDARIRAAAFATPLAARAAFAKSIVTVPATRSALARTVIAVNPNDIAVRAIRHLAHVCRGGIRHGSCRRQKNRSSHGLERSNHCLLLEIKTDGTLHRAPVRPSFNGLSFSGVPGHELRLGQAIGVIGVKWPSPYLS